jgi:hypothetical protein
MVLERVNFNYEEMRINFLNDVTYAKHRQTGEPLFTDTMRKLIEIKVDTGMFRSHMIRHFATLMSSGECYVIPADRHPLAGLIPEMHVEVLNVTQTYAECDILTPSVDNYMEVRSARIAVEPIVIARFESVEDDKHPLVLNGLDLGFLSYMPCQYIGGQYVIEEHKTVEKAESAHDKIFVVNGHSYHYTKDIFGYPDASQSDPNQLHRKLR